MEVGTLVLIILAVISTVLGVMLILSYRKYQRLEELLSHTTAKLERLQLHFGRFTPDEVIEHLTDKSGEYSADLKDVTVLFADIKGFTSMCERMEPKQVVNVLNGYFRVMSQVISRHHGQVTELMGDGLLALFGALRHNPWQVQDAVQAALDMRKALAQYNEQVRDKLEADLSFGIGIHKGTVLAGVMGNFELSKFGVVGDTINVAARVESLTRVHGCDILVTEEVICELHDRFSIREMPAVPIKGKEVPLVTYFIEGHSKSQSGSAGTSSKSSRS